MSRIHCKRNGCNAVLEPVTDNLGRVTHVCRPCQRNKAGRCRDCSTGVVVASRPGFFPFRCEKCHDANHKRTRNKSNLRSYYANRRARLAQMRKRYRTDPEARAAILERQRVYREANPRTEVDKQLHRIYSQRSKAKKKVEQERNKAVYRAQKARAA